MDGLADLVSLIVPKHGLNWEVTMAECHTLSDASFHFAYTYAEDAGQLETVFPILPW
jgi:hypothetical protein